MKRFISNFILIIFLLTLPAFSACQQETGYTTITGLYVKTDSGHHVLIRDDHSPYLFITPAPDSQTSFNDLSTGDTIQVKIVLIKEAYSVETTEVIECQKTVNFKSEISADILTQINILSEQLE